MAEEITTSTVYAIASDITSSLGFGVQEHWSAVASGKRGIEQYIEGEQSYYASRIDVAKLSHISAVTKQELSPFEKLCVFSAKASLANLTTPIDLNNTVFVLSTTKGNIDQLDIQPDNKTLLATSAEVISKEVGIAAQSVVVSHACVSGAVALLYAHRLLSSGRYQHAVVVGCDLFTPFVLYGFLSFQAIADAPCRPFDADRTGINLGEAAATIVLSAEPSTAPLGILMGGATSNDANHISGPSRTGEELSAAINRAMAQAGLKSTAVSMVSAHGTATAYNDEMEAKALNLSGLSNTPVHSMKSYTGHTLGAAGVLESAMILEAINQQQLIPSAGYEKHGVSVPVNVTTQMQAAPINYVLKTASGFGGSNAAIIWGKP